MFQRTHVPCTAANTAAKRCCCVHDSCVLLQNGLQLCVYMCTARLATACCSSIFSSWPVGLCCTIVSYAGFGYLVGFTLLLNYLAFLALKFYSGQQARASVSTNMIVSATKSLHCAELLTLGQKWGAEHGRASYCSAMLSLDDADGRFLAVTEGWRCSKLRQQAMPAVADLSIGMSCQELHTMSSSGAAC